MDELLIVTFIVLPVLGFILVHKFGKSAYAQGFEDGYHDGMGHTMHHHRPIGGIQRRNYEQG
jgi:hypothetical protein